MCHCDNDARVYRIVNRTFHAKQFEKKSVISYDWFLQWHKAKQYESDNYLKIRMRYIYFKDKKLNNNNEVKDLEKITSDN